MHMRRLPSFLHAQKEWEPNMGARSDRPSHALGMFLAVYLSQLILQEISSTVWVFFLGGWASGSSKVMSCVTLVLKAERWGPRTHV